jgi:hypothetical protein
MDRAIQTLRELMRVLITQESIDLRPYHAIMGRKRGAQNRPRWLETSQNRMPSRLALTQQR